MAKSDPTDWKLEKLSDRLAVLLKQEPNPRAAMEAIASRLSEEGLSQYSPRRNETPDQFALNVIEANPEMREIVAEMPLPNLGVIETADELISRLLPSQYDHG